MTEWPCLQCLKSRVVALNVSSVRTRVKFRNLVVISVFSIVLIPE